MKTCSAYFSNLFSLLFVNCKKKTMKRTSKKTLVPLTKAILTVKCARPFGATQNGQNEYNDQLQFEMTTSFRKQLAFFNKYQTALDKVKEATLTPEEKNSYEIIKWEVEVGRITAAYKSDAYSSVLGTHHHGAICRRNQCTTI
jgi:2-keto-4-pentenoate hydratase/2-oxohepta-3-ene-1,7-dioic acid hydratase in catechol pathway